MRFVSSKFCLACLGCCRFHDINTVWLPYKIKPNVYKDLYVCPHLDIKTNKCKIYPRRPLDCKIYPFVLAKRENQVYIALHKLCLFIEENISKLNLKSYTDGLVKYLLSSKNKKFILDNPGFIKEYPKDELIFLDKVNIDTKLINLSIRDKKLINSYLKISKYTLSAYSFENIFLWKCLYDITYCFINANLCIFFKDSRSCFMNFFPLGEKIDIGTIEKCFEIMNSVNKNKAVSRIENIEDGFGCREMINCVSTDRPQYFLKPKFKEYLYATKDMIELRGDKFKSKRSALNYFLKNYNYEFMPFNKEYTKEAISLYKNWSGNRQLKFNKDDVYCMMIKDNLILHEFLMKNFAKLVMNGYVVKIYAKGGSASGGNGKIKAYSFGYPINKDTFCIFAEITDLEIKGLAQFIFWQFCKKLTMYKFINVMDDSGISNLEKVKMSYRPHKLINSYILTQNE
ncbi:MAG: phosphatidylglycerol lysyltransferase domain-containing protein [Candidatus Omnitrophota bacterium]